MTDAQVLNQTSGLLTSGRVAVVALLAMVVILLFGFFMIGYTEGVKEYTYSTPNANITIAATYPRMDAYLNHASPYVITTDRKIYSVTSDIEWAKLEIGSSYSVGVDTSNKLDNGRPRDGMIYSVLKIS